MDVTRDESGESASATHGDAGEGTRDLTRGAILGRYRIIEEVGSGGMGIVYAAYDPELRRRVAIKLLRPDPSESPARAEILRARLVHEAQAMASVSHPNVIHVYDIGTVGDDVFVAMELVDGQTLGAWLAAEPRGASEILRVFTAAAHGLAAAHAAGLVHRDFKPDNVLVGHDGRVRVADFGVARSIDVAADAAEAFDAGASLSDVALTRTGALIGTPAYMAPEQLLGDEADARSDQFAFAVALWEALHGARPFAGTTPAALAAAIERREPNLGTAGDRVPRVITRALETALAARPADRFGSMDALVAALAGEASSERRLRLDAAPVFESELGHVVGWR